MALVLGQKLGSYEVLSLLGRGGMGEVYRARDTKLKREVAIKVLPDAFTRDAERVARFQIEAEVLASLNHPRIAAIYDLADSAERRRLSWIAAGILLLVVADSVLVAVIHFREPVNEDQSIRFVITAPDNATVFGVPPAISPDGKRLAFVATSGGKTQLWIRPLDSVTAQPLPGTDNADYPFWSPDSRSIAFADGGKLKKIDIPGGPAQTLCDIPGVMRGGAWNNDGVIIFGITAAGLYRVSSSGGAAVPLTTIEPGEISHRGPSFLPDVGIYNTTNGAFSVSGLGVIAYSFGSTGGRQLSWLDRTGKVIEKVGPFMAYADLALSPIRSGLPFNSSIMTCGSWT